MSGWEPYKEGVDFEWVRTDSHNALVRRFYTKEEKMARRAASTKQEPAKPKSKPKSVTRPKARPSRGIMTSTKLEEPYPQEMIIEGITEVEDKYTPGMNIEGGDADKAEPTLGGYTWSQYKEGNNLGRLRAGLPAGLSKREFEKRATKEQFQKDMGYTDTVKPKPRRGDRARRRNGLMAPQVEIR